MWFVPLAFLAADVTTYEDRVTTAWAYAAVVHAKPDVCSVGTEVELQAGKLTEDLRNPMPGGITAGYAVDTGLDIVGSPRDVFAIASGIVEYAEAGHTAWTSKSDSPFSIRIKLDAPISHEGRKITHVYYSHLSRLAWEKKEGEGPERRVAAGERIACSGKANQVNHLHLGLLLDDDTSQRWGTYLGEAEVRAVFGGLRARQRLPAE